MAPRNRLGNVRVVGQDNPRHLGGHITERYREGHVVLPEVAHTRKALEGQRVGALVAARRRAGQDDVLKPVVRRVEAVALLETASRLYGARTRLGRETREQADALRALLSRELGVE